jgi:hypothetical protein
MPDFRKMDNLRNGQRSNRESRRKVGFIEDKRRFLKRINMFQWNITLITPMDFITLGTLVISRAVSRHVS